MNMVHMVNRKECLYGMNTSNMAVNTLATHTYLLYSVICVHFFFALKLLLLVFACIHATCCSYTHKFVRLQLTLRLIVMFFSGYICCRFHWNCLRFLQWKCENLMRNLLLCRVSIIKKMERTSECVSETVCYSTSQHFMVWKNYWR